MADVRAEQPPQQANDGQANEKEQRPEQASPEYWEGRVNVAEEFYLRVTARPDVRELLKRLANM